MNLAIYEKLKKISKKFPNKPGVYFWRNKKGAPLYIGRAGSLKKRIANYFVTPKLGEGGSRLDPRIREMTQVAHSLDFEETDSLLEAIVLEANLIKQYWPKYNILEKDGKSFIYLVITDEEFPRLLLVRGRELDKYSVSLRHSERSEESRLKTERDPSGVPQDDKQKKKRKQYGTLGVFGPYQSYYLLRKALEIVRKIFPYSNCRPPDYSLIRANKRIVSKPCFHYQIGLCPGVCVGAIDAKTYRNNIRNLILFFRGEKKQLLKKLQKEEALPSKTFGKSLGGRDAILALKQVRDTALLADSDVLLRGNQLTDRRIEGYDISHSGGKQPVGAMVVFENGEPARDQYRLFNIRGPASSSAINYKLSTINSSDDLAMLQEVLGRRLKHSEWPLPQIVFVDGGVNQVRRVNAVLKRHNLTLPVVGLGKAGQHAASSAGQDKLVVANAKKTGKELIIASRNLFQQVRNEAHRFAISAQRRRGKNTFLPRRLPPIYPS